MILIIPDTLVLLARINVQVSASKVSDTMTATTHQQQVFSQVWPVVDFKLMSSPLFHESQCSYLHTQFSRYLGGGYYKKSHFLALTRFRTCEIQQAYLQLPASLYLGTIEVVRPCL